MAFGEIIFKTCEMRPCWVHGKKALFHRWQEKAQTIRPSLRDGHPGGFLWETVAIVEYEDGTVHECYPYELRFVPGGVFDDYDWTDPAEVTNEKTYS